MYNVEFYEDRNGKEPILDLLKELQEKGKTSKKDRVRSEKILQYIRILQEYGTRVGVPYVKNIEGELWELRPFEDRIFFFYYNEEGTFILVHHFIKKTRKTPAKEIEQAKRNLQDHKERKNHYGNKF
jgi:phage-related protein